MENEKYYFVDSEGTYLVFYRYVDLLRHLYYHGMWTVGNNFNDTYRDYNHGRYSWDYKWGVAHHIVLDKYERVVHTTQLKKDLVWFQENIQRLNKEYDRRCRRKSQWRHYDHPFKFRRDPVPGTGGGRYRNYGRYFRKPRTTQERRAYCREDRQYIRAARNGSNLPSNWDDIYRGDLRRVQSWKNSKKKKQWM